MQAALSVAGDLYSDKEPAKLDRRRPAQARRYSSRSPSIPTKIALKGIDDAQQLVLTATLAGGRLQDLTGDVKYEVGRRQGRPRHQHRPGHPARPTARPRSPPRYGDKVVKVPVTTESCDVNLPINFANQIVPIFTKLGCNSGGCHGKAGGQNGFKLSLLGFEPEVDYQTPGQGRPRPAPVPRRSRHSLLLLKAAGTMAHGGGKRMEVGSDEYKLIRRWIAAGTPFGEHDRSGRHQDHRRIPSIAS